MKSSIVFAAGLLLSAGYLQAATEYQLVPESVSASLFYPAQIEAVNKSTVSAQTSGRISALPFDVNDLVNAGDVIVRFTDTEQKARLQQTEAALQEAKSRLTEAERELVRATELFGQKLIAQAQLDAASANAKAAKARTAQAVAAVAEAKEQLEQTLVRAPYPGIVTARHVEVGELAVPGKALMSGLSLQQLRVEFSIPQSQVDLVRQHQQLQVVLADGQSLKVDRLTIFPAADPATHSFKARLDLNQNQTALYPGSAVQVQVTTAAKPSLWLPASAMRQRGEQQLVRVKQGNQWLLQPVRLGRTDAQNRFQVLAGVEAGDVVQLSQE